MNKADARTANMLGALALMMTDAMGKELGELTDICESDWAALIVIEQNPGITVDRLARIVRLSQPGAVRMINRLVEEGRVERQQGADRRARPLALTPEGQRMVRAMLLGREKVLREPLDALSSDERQTLTRLMEKMLHSLATDVATTDTACRLCDDGACPQESCPLTPGCTPAA
ncbi:MarR family winged helix-turn-helix transcriptional regulator [Dongia sp.]|uniref:MarR family winged helix-turn-helix transcriptional regulator n=1 Tax=Dongia sp. TaxID=1977262 RepID=UPI0035B2D6B2